LEIVILFELILYMLEHCDGSGFGFLHVTI